MARVFPHILLPTIAARNGDAPPSDIDGAWPEPERSSTEAGTVDTVGGDTIAVLVELGGGSGVAIGVVSRCPTISGASGGAAIILRANSSNSSSVAMTSNEPKTSRRCPGQVVASCFAFLPDESPVARRWPDVECARLSELIESSWSQFVHSDDWRRLSHVLARNHIYDDGDEGSLEALFVSPQPAARPLFADQIVALFSSATSSQHPSIDTPSFHHLDSHPAFRFYIANEPLPFALAAKTMSDSVFTAFCPSRRAATKILKRRLFVVWARERYANTLVCYASSVERQPHDSVDETLARLLASPTPLLLIRGSRRFIFQVSSFDRRVRISGRGVAMKGRKRIRTERIDSERERMERSSDWYYYDGDRAKGRGIEQYDPAWRTNEAYEGGRYERMERMLIPKVR